MACAINMNNDQAINQFSLSYLKQLVQTCHDFIHKVYYLSLIHISRLYVSPWLNRKSGEFVTARTFRAPEPYVHLYQHLSLIPI